jgi:hypothetical protein
MRCGALPKKREPYTTSAGPGTMGFSRVLYPPWSYLGSRILRQQVLAGCHRNTWLVSRTLPLVYIVLYVFEIVDCKTLCWLYSFARMKWC